VPWRAASSVACGRPVLAEPPQLPIRTRQRLVRHGHLPLCVPPRSRLLRKRLLQGRTALQRPAQLRAERLALCCRLLQLRGQHGHVGL
jgi:hypothetical protein